MEEKQILDQNEGQNKSNSDTNDNHANVQNSDRRHERNNNRRGRKDNNRRMKKPVKDDFDEKVVTINRVTKVTKGGRHFRFAAVVVVGNKKGLVGLGTGKANEVPDAIKKAAKEARKNLVRVPVRKTTVPHEIVGHYGAGKVLIKPAKEGTGVIAGGPARAVIELAGIADIYTKSLGSNNPINMIRATLDGLTNMQTWRNVKNLRSEQKVEEPTNNNVDSTPNASSEVAEQA